MKKIDIANLKYTDSQGALDDILYKISSDRYAQYIDGIFIPSLSDIECEDLYTKAVEFIECLKDAYEKSQSKIVNDMTSKEPANVFWIED